MGDADRPRKGRPSASGCFFHSDAPHGTLALSPSDLSAHLACPHLTTLSAARRARRAPAAAPRDAAPRPHLPQGERARAGVPGAARGRGRIDRPDPDLRRRDFDAARLGGSRRRRSAPGRRRHLPAVPHRRGRWRGFADFLERLPSGTYEPVDTKLARSAKPAHVLQLCFYASRSRGSRARPVEHVHVENGAGERETFRVAELEAYYRRIRERLPRRARRRAGDLPAGRATTAGSATSARSATRSESADDHLTLVAGLRRSAAETLDEAGVTTLEALGERRRGRPGRRRCGPRRSRGCAARPRSSSAARRRDCTSGSSSPDEPERGLPAPPCARRGRRLARPRGPPVLRDPPRARVPVRLLLPGRGRRGRVRGAVGEGSRRRARGLRAVRRLARRAAAAHPGMHVYHYAAYERTALTRLMGEHGTREEEVDGLLARRGSRRPLPRREAVAPRLGRQLLHQDRRGALRVRAHRRRRGRRRVGRALRGVARDRATTPSSRTSSATTRRTAARPSRCTSGSSRSVRAAAVA